MKNSFSRYRFIFPVLWIFLSLTAVMLDYYTGMKYDFPLLIAIPIVLATWYSGRFWGIVTGLIITAGEICIIYSRLDSIDILTVVLYITVRIIILFVFIFMIDIISRQRRSIRVMSGLLPICSFCKKIRDENGNWVELEQYINEKSDARLCHGLCTDCARDKFFLHMDERNI